MSFFQNLKAKVMGLIVKAEDPVHRELVALVHELVTFLEQELPAIGTAVGGAVAGSAGAATGGALGAAAEAALQKK